jgi:hypothetical protein
MSGYAQVISVSILRLRSSISDVNLYLLQTSQLKVLFMKRLAEFYEQQNTRNRVLLKGVLMMEIINKPVILK